MAEEISFHEELVIEAKRAGKRFIKVRLNPRHWPSETSEEKKITGGVELRGHRRPGVGGHASWGFSERRDGDLRFNWDPRERDFICMMYDDQGPGYFSGVGFNRDLLASHYGDGMFVIDDPDVIADVQNRIENLQGSKSKSYEEKQAFKSRQQASVIDRQVRELEERKKRLIQEAEKKQKAAEFRKKQSGENPNPADGAVFDPRTNAWIKPGGSIPEQGAPKLTDVEPQASAGGRLPSEEEEDAMVQKTLTKGSGEPPFPQDAGTGEPPPASESSEQVKALKGILGD